MLALSSSKGGRRMSSAGAIGSGGGGGAGGAGGAGGPGDATTGA